MSASEWQGRELHFIAIGGAGMSALALVATGLGATVTGSDRSESTYMERLRFAGLDPAVGHDAERVPPGADVVVSTAIPADNPELEIARERGQRVIHRGELLAEIAAVRRLLAVAGTHGKTTSSGMAAWALRRLGADPSFVIGGELTDPEGDGAANGRIGAGEWLIAEADESDGSFLRLRPEIALITNVELDHHERWGSKAELLDAFRAFAEPTRGLAIHADAGLEAVAAGHPTVERFDSERPGPPPELAVPGAHNRLNARGVMAALGLCGFDPAEVAEALADFPGMGRRQEAKGTFAGALIYDDYAHHPTEVVATMEAFRELAPRRLIALFQPHLYSRTKAFAARFGEALAAADAVGVLDVYAARESPVGELAGVSGLDVARATADRSGGKPVWWLAEHARAAEFLAGELGPGDLLVTIGAGDVFRVGGARRPRLKGPPRRGRRGEAMAQRASTAAGRRRASARATTASSAPRKPPAKPAGTPKPAKPRKPAKGKPAVKASARAGAAKQPSRAAARRPAPGPAPKQRHGERGIVAALSARRRRRISGEPDQTSAKPAAARQGTKRTKPAPAPRSASRLGLLAAPLRAVARVLPAARGARIAVIVLLVAVLGTGYHFWLRDSTLVAIDDVEVEGLSGPDGPAIAAALTKSAEGMTTLNADPEALRAAVEGFPVVRDVEIDTGLPNAATITVTETPPAMIARVNGDEETDVPVANDGTLLPGASTDGLDLPVMELSKPPRGDELADAALEQALVIGSAPDPLRPLIETIDYSTGEGVSIGLDGGVELEFGAAEKARAKWGSAAAVMADPKLTQLASIDLRVPERPAVG